MGMERTKLLRHSGLKNSRGLRRDQRMAQTAQDTLEQLKAWKKALYENSLDSDVALSRQDRDYTWAGKAERRMQTSVKAWTKIEEEEEIRREDEEGE